MDLMALRFKSILGRCIHICPLADGIAGDWDMPAMRPPFGPLTPACRWARGEAETTRPRRGAVGRQN